jgi:hypothetical protein
MPANRIMLIRHAERPSDDGAVKGVAVSGAQDPQELSVRGWQRSGALVRFFAPLSGKLVDQRLVTPAVIFAAAVAKTSESVRPQHTVLELATALNLTPVLRYAKGEEAKLVEAAEGRGGPVLIAWEHDAIPGVANRILGDMTRCPQKWPDTRFDLVWVLDRQPSGHWTFAQVPQMLLAGDSAMPI